MLQTQYADLQEKYTKLLATRETAQIEAQEDLQARVAWAICCCVLIAALPMMIYWKAGLWRVCCGARNGRFWPFMPDSGVPTHPLY